MLLSLLFAAALAETVAPPEAPLPAEVPAAAPETREEAWEQLGPDALMQQALAFQADGRRGAALERLAYLSEHHPDPAVTFEIGKTLELDEDYAAALAAYDDVLSGGGQELVHHNAAFRRAIVLEDLGRHKDSLAQIKALQDAGTWTAAEALSLELCRGIAELSAGRTRKGLQRIDAALVALEGSTEQTWMRARARAALVDYLLDEAAGFELKGDKKAARRLQKRNTLMLSAEQQVISIAQLGETEYILVGLQRVGDAYLRLHDDLLAAPPPRKLSDAQEAEYTTLVAERSGILKRKARVYYDKGLQLADQVGWEGKAREALAARLAQL